MVGKWQAVRADPDAIRGGPRIKPQATQNLTGQTKQKLNRLLRRMSGELGSRGQETVARVEHFEEKGVVNSFKGKRDPEDAG